MNATYRCPRVLRWLGLMFLAGGAAFPALSLLGAGAFPPDTREIIVTLLITRVLLLIGTALLLRAWRHRLVVSEAEVEYVGILGSRRIALDDVLEARWRLHAKAGSLRLTTASDKMKIEFDLYGRPARRALIRFFRLRLAEDIQHNWEKYWCSHWRQFDEPDPAKAKGFARGDCGGIAKQCSLRPRLHVALIVGFTLFVLTSLLSLLLAAFVIPGGLVVFLSGLACSLVLLLVGCTLEGVRIKRANSEAAKLAEQEYLQPPGSSRGHPP